MKISNIDKDFVNIINYLDSKGLKPWASCDGVLKNHTDPKSVTSAYISFLKSPQIFDLMAAFLRDKDTFEVTISNNSSRTPKYYYDNLISGNTYSVKFSNKTGKVTPYFEKIAVVACESHLPILSNERERLENLSDVLENDDNSDLYFSVTLNSRYQPYMNKSGIINVLRVSTKDGYDYARNMSSLLDILSEKFGTIKKSSRLEEIFSEGEEEFAVLSDNSLCEIYFTDNHLQQILEQIKYIREIAHTLPTFEVKECDYEFDDEDDYCI